MKSCEELYTAIEPLIESGDYETAIDEMEQLLSSYADFATGHHELGALYLATGQKDRAFEHYQKAADLDPQNTGILKQLADFYYTEKNNADNAKSLYSQIIEQDPEHVEVLQILGNLAVVDRDFETAKTFYKRVLDLEPWNHDALIIIEKLEQHEIKQANDQNDDSAYVHSQRLVQEGKIDEAIHVLEELIKLEPDFALAYNDLGVLYYQTDQKEKTLKCYEEAVRLDPDQLNYKKNLADFYFVELGEVEKALEIYFRLLNEDPTDIETLMATGYICRALKRDDDAIVFFERVLDIEPWNFEASDNINQLNPMKIDSL
jgi:tetratricopeptide (TPR) repeat protein